MLERRVLLPSLEIGTSIVCAANDVIMIGLRRNRHASTAASMMLRTRQDLIRRFGETTNPFVAEKTARAVLLAPLSDEQLRTAVSLADRAVRGKADAPELRTGEGYRYRVVA